MREAVFMVSPNTENFGSLVPDKEDARLHFNETRARTSWGNSNISSTIFCSPSRSPPPYQFAQ